MAVFAFYIVEFPAGGTGTAVLHTANGLVRNGHRVVKSMNSKGLPTGRILYDFDREKEEKEKKEFEARIEEAIRTGHNYCKCNFHTDTMGGYTGYEIDTHKKYVARRDVSGTYFHYYVVDEPIQRENVAGALYYYYPLVLDTIRVISYEEFEEMTWWRNRDSYF